MPHGLTVVSWHEKQMVIKEGSGGVVGTGAVVSGSASTFLEFLSFISGDVLELGSGTGVVAIGAAIQGCSVVATDVSINPHGCSKRSLKEAKLDDRPDEVKHLTGSFSDMLCVIERNTLLNQMLIDKSGGSVTVFSLHWGNSWELDNLLMDHYGGFDYIIGCNITYQTASYPALMGVIKNLSLPHTKIFLATSDVLGDNQELSRVAIIYGMQVRKVLSCPTTSTTIMEIFMND